MAIVTPTWNDKDLTRIVQAIKQIGAGRSNSVGSVTLTPSATSTTVAFDNCSSESEVFLTPRTANAAGAVATTFVASVSNGGFTITHVSAVSADRTFGFACIG